MKTVEVTLVNKLGMHARPSAKVAQTATQFKSQVWMKRNGRKINAKSIMGVMMLAAPLGAAVEAITLLFASGFGEELA
jgi:phosphocarrier protein HPr